MIHQFKKGDKVTVREGAKSVSGHTRRPEEVRTVNRPGRQADTTVLDYVPGTYPGNVFKTEDLVPYVEAPADVDMWVAKDALQAEVAAEVFQTPAPLDPSKVKAGDTVTLEVTPAGKREKPYTLSGEVYDSAGGLMVGGLWVMNDSFATITAHQPAPEPEPEWLVEFKGEEGPEGDEHWSKRFSTREDAVQSLRSSVQSYELDDFHGPVSFSIYSEATGPVENTPAPEPEWKPGMFASARIRGYEQDGERYRGFFDANGHFYFPDSEGQESAPHKDAVTDVKPLVVIDPAEVDVDALAKVYASPYYGAGTDWTRESVVLLLAELGIEAS